MINNEDFLQKSSFQTVEKSRFASKSGLNLCLIMSLHRITLKNSKKREKYAISPAMNRIFFEVHRCKFKPAPICHLMTCYNKVVTASPKVI